MSQQNAFSRRRFLQVSMASAAAAFGGVAFNLSPAQAAELAARRQSNTLRVAWGNPATLDPLTASADAEIAFLNAVYDYLIDTDVDFNLVPRLAESWEVNEDGTQYTLTIRDGVTFHDGSELTLDDILWTFDYHLNQDGPVAGLLSDLENIEPGEGDNTLVFTLSNPNPDFLYFLSDNRLVILKQDAENIGEEFNGTGPFVLQEYTPGDRAVFSAYQDYWGEVPSLETLEFIYFDDPQAAVSALEGGQVDVALRMDNATFFSLASDPNFTAQDVATSGHDLARLRADRAPGDDPRVQQAFKLATDRQAIYERIQLGFGSLGKDSPIGPVYGAFHNEDLELAERNVEEARNLLAEAGYEDGLDIDFYVPNSGDRPLLAQQLAAQWEEAGINANIILQDEATYYAEDGWLEVDLGITGWGARPVPQIFLNQYVTSDGVWNESHWSNERVDELIALAGSTTDEQERIDAYHEIQQIMLEEGPIIVPYFFAAFMVHDAAVSGLQVQPFPGRTNFNTASY
ncbi:MAG: ABC transporter substrate-binding protein [Anaerolineales bacterium]